jgi:phosphatidylglycerol:prolipoprotein diacylglycerol transferase
VGGRLGQALLYDPAYYASHPAEIVQPWKGGMSFHGALVGAIIAILLYARRTAVAARTLMDLACAGIPIGVLLGRIANFINSEHWGHASDVPWAMVFPNGGDTPRHPSQLYEALLEGLALFALLRIVTHRRLGLARPGLVAGVWLLGYGGARIVCEVFREPETGHALNIGPVTAGQLFSAPMIAFGIYLVRTAARPATVIGKTA